MSPHKEAFGDRRRRRGVPLGALSLTLLLAWATTYGFRSTGPGQAWEAAATAAVTPLETGVWRLLRGTLAYLSIPAMLLVCACAVWFLFRRGRASEVIGVIVLVAGANATVQAIKHPLVPGLAQPGGSPVNLSGHVAVAGATCFAVLLAAKPDARGRGGWVGWAFVSGLSAAILLTRWHTISEVLTPLFVSGAWAVATYSVLGWMGSTGPQRRVGSRVSGASALLATSGLVALSLMCIPGVLYTLDWFTQGGSARVLALSFTLVAASAAVTTGLASQLLPADDATTCVGGTGPAQPRPAKRDAPGPGPVR